MEQMAFPTEHSVQTSSALLDYVVAYCPLPVAEIIRFVAVQPSLFDQETSQ